MAFIVAASVGLVIRGISSGIKGVQSGIQAHKDYKATENESIAGPSQREGDGEVREGSMTYRAVMKAEERMGRKGKGKDRAGDREDHNTRDIDRQGSKGELKGMNKEKMESEHTPRTMGPDDIPVSCRLGMGMT